MATVKVRKVNTANVTAAKPKIGGGVWRAPIGTALPTDAATELAEAFESLGYISADGLTNTNFSEKETIQDWSGTTVFEAPKEKPDKFKFTLLESMSVPVLKVIYGDDNVSGDLETGLTIKANDDEHDDYVWVVEMVQNNVLKRIVIPCASVSGIGDIVYVANKPVSYEVTISAKRDDAGQTHYDYMKKKTPEGT